MLQRQQVRPSKRWWDHWERSTRNAKAGLPDGCSQIFRLYAFGPLGLKDYGSATLRCKFDPFLSLDCGGLNLIPSFPWIVPGWRAWGRNPRKGRNLMLPSGNLVQRSPQGSIWEHWRVFSADYWPEIPRVPRWPGWRLEAWKENVGYLLIAVHMEHMAVQTDPEHQLQE